MSKARDIADLFSSANSANGFVKLDGSSNLPSVNGSALTSLTAGNLTGTLPAIDGASLTGIEGVNTGLILPYGKDEAPTGFLACDGSAVSRSTYSALFTIIGTTWGTGDGSSTFNVPDLQDKVPLGKSSSKAHASTGGAENVTPTGSVSLSINSHTLSTSQIPSHSHDVYSNPHTGGASSGNKPVAGNYGYPNNGIGTSSHVLNFAQVNRNIPYGDFTITSTGSGSGHNHSGSGSLSANAMSVLQPYVAIKYIIKT